MCKAQHVFLYDYFYSCMTISYDKIYELSNNAIELQEMKQEKYTFHFEDLFNKLKLPIVRSKN